MLRRTACTLPMSLCTTYVTNTFNISRYMAYLCLPLIPRCIFCHLWMDCSLDLSHMNEHHDLFYSLASDHAYLLAHFCGYYHEMRWHSLPEMQYFFRKWC
ncbi:unnamed protein product [Prunus brigantina]